jgi:Domain of unknown function (DUF4440)
MFAVCQKAKLDRLAWHEYATRRRAKDKMGEAFRSDEEAVSDVDRRWNEVYLRNDRSAFAEILADDFRVIFSDGRTGDKSDLMRPTPVVAQVAFSEAGMRVFTPTAVTWGRIRIELPERVVDQRFVRVFSKRHSGWQAVFVFVSPVSDVT